MISVRRQSLPPRSKGQRAKSKESGKGTLSKQRERGPSVVVVKETQPEKGRNLETKTRIIGFVCREGRHRVSIFAIPRTWAPGRCKNQ